MFQNFRVYYSIFSTCILIGHFVVFVLVVWRFRVVNLLALASCLVIRRYFQLVEADALSPACFVHVFENAMNSFPFFLKAFRVALRALYHDFKLKLVL